MTGLAKTDAGFMARAIQLARNGLYTTDPNPRVGCVIVKNNQIIAEGWHAKAGCDHAEVEALKKTNEAEGATAYVTLEPCSHHGRTPPCCETLIQAKLTRVVVAMQDPNPLVAGNGIKNMLLAGIQVDCGVLQQDAEALNKGFIKRMRDGLPYVFSKMAMSLDGRTALASGESKWITGEQARSDVQRLRAQSSAILTGINTVLADDPSMNVRTIDNIEQPVRVVLDSSLKIPIQAKILAVPGRTLILTCSNDEHKKHALEQAGAEVYQITSKNNRLDLHEVLKFLAKQQFNTVMVEAGATLNGEFLSGALVDEWVVYMSTVVLGDEGRGLFKLPGLQSMADRKQLNLIDVRQLGADIRLTLSGQETGV